MFNLVWPSLHAFSRKQSFVDCLWDQGPMVERCEYYTYFKAVNNRCKEKAMVKVGDPRTNRVKLEADALFTLQRKMKSTYGVPKILGYFENSFVQTMIVEPFGPSLKSMHEAYGGLSLKTALMVVDQLLLTLANLHSNGIFHGNINGRNVRVGCDSSSNQIVLINLENAALQRFKNGDLPLSESEVLKCRAKDVQDLWKLIKWCMTKRDRMGNISTPDMPGDLQKFTEIYDRFQKDGGNGVYEELRTLLFDCYERLKFVADGKFDWSSM